MKILVTGSAGFIGFNLAHALLKKKHLVYGIDSYDNYYSNSSFSDFIYSIYFINFNLLSFMDHQIIKNRNHLLVYYTKI